MNTLTKQFTTLLQTPNRNLKKQISFDVSLSVREYQEYIPYMLKNCYKLLMSSNADDRAAACVILRGVRREFVVIEYEKEEIARADHIAENEQWNLSCDTGNDIYMNEKTTKSRVYLNNETAYKLNYDLNAENDFDDKKCHVIAKNPNMQNQLDSISDRTNNNAEKIYEQNKIKNSIKDNRSNASYFDLIDKNLFLGATGKEYAQEAISISDMKKQVSKHAGIDDRFVKVELVNESDFSKREILAMRRREKLKKKINQTEENVCVEKSIENVSDFFNSILNDLTHKEWHRRDGAFAAFIELLKDEESCEDIDCKYERIDAGNLTILQTMSDNKIENKNFERNSNFDNKKKIEIYDKTIENNIILADSNIKNEGKNLMGNNECKVDNEISCNNDNRMINNEINIEENKTIDENKIYINNSELNKDNKISMNKKELKNIIDVKNNIDKNEDKIINDENDLHNKQNSAFAKKKENPNTILFCVPKNLLLKALQVLYSDKLVDFVCDQISMPVREKACDLICIIHKNYIEMHKNRANAGNENSHNSIHKNTKFMAQLENKASNFNIDVGKLSITDNNILQNSSDSKLYKVYDGEYDKIIETIIIMLESEDWQIQCSAIITLQKIISCDAANVDHTQQIRIANILTKLLLSKDEDIKNFCANLLCLLPIENEEIVLEYCWKNIEDSNEIAIGKKSILTLISKIYKRNKNITKIKLNMSKLMYCFRCPISDVRTSVILMVREIYHYMSDNEKLLLLRIIIEGILLEDNNEIRNELLFNMGIILDDNINYSTVLKHYLNVICDDLDEEYKVCDFLWKGDELLYTKSGCKLIGKYEIIKSRILFLSMIYNKLIELQKIQTNHINENIDTETKKKFCNKIVDSKKDNSCDETTAIEYENKQNYVASEFTGTLNVINSPLNETVNSFNENLVKHDDLLFKENHAKYTKLILFSSEEWKNIAYDNKIYKVIFYTVLNTIYGYENIDYQLNTFFDVNFLKELTKIENDDSYECINPKINETYKNYIRFKSIIDLNKACKLKNSKNEQNSNKHEPKNTNHNSNNILNYNKEQYKSMSSSVSNNNEHKNTNNMEPIYQSKSVDKTHKNCFFESIKILFLKEENDFFLELISKIIVNNKIKLENEIYNIITTERIKSNDDMRESKDAVTKNAHDFIKKEMNVEINFNNIFNVKKKEKKIASIFFKEFDVLERSFFEFVKRDKNRIKFFKNVLEFVTEKKGIDYIFYEALENIYRVNVNDDEKSIAIKNNDNHIENCATDSTLLKNYDDNRITKQTELNTLKNSLIASSNTNDDLLNKKKKNCQTKSLSVERDENINDTDILCTEYNLNIQNTYNHNNLQENETHPNMCREIYDIKDDIEVIKFFIKHDNKYAEFVAYKLYKNLNITLLKEILSDLNPSYYFLYPKKLLKIINTQIKDREDANFCFSYIVPFLTIKQILKNINEKLKKKIYKCYFEIEELYDTKKDYKIEFPMTIELRDYQKKGVSWISFLYNYGLNGVLADDMGLGKTIMVLTFICNELYKYKIKNEGDNNVSDSSSIDFNNDDNKKDNENVINSTDVNDDSFNLNSINTNNTSVKNINDINSTNKDKTSLKSTNTNNSGRIMLGAKSSNTNNSGVISTSVISHNITSHNLTSTNINRTNINRININSTNNINTSVINIDNNDTGNNNHGKRNNCTENNDRRSFNDTDNKNKRTNHKLKINNNVIKQKVLIISPSSLTGHWEDEIKRKFSILKCKIYKRKEENNEEITIVSFDIFRNDYEFFTNQHWFYIIIDEGHILKNRETLLYKRTMLLNADHKLVLTGTPIHNTVEDIFSLFNFLMPFYLGTEKEFINNYSKAINTAREIKATDREVDKAEKKILELHKKILPFVLRRLKSEVLKDLPPKIVTDIIIELDDEEREEYSRLEVGDDDFQRYEDVKGNSFKRMGEMLKVCSHKGYIKKDRKKIINGKEGRYDTMQDMNSKLVKHNIYNTDEYTNVKSNSLITNTSSTGKNEATNKINLINQDELLSKNESVIRNEYRNEYLSRNDIMKQYIKGKKSIEENKFNVSECELSNKLNDTQCINKDSNIIYNNTVQEMTIKKGVKRSKVIYKSNTDSGVASMNDDNVNVINKSDVTRKSVVNTKYNKEYDNHANDSNNNVENIKMYGGKGDGLSNKNLSAKVKALLDIVNLCGGSEMKSKILIFCQLKSTIDLIIKDLKHFPVLRYTRIDGSVKSELRNKIAQEFNEGDFHLMFLTTQVGGLGLNLTGADTVVMYEHDWNPFNDLQAMDRAHRIGQKRTVNVYRLITKKTIEERIMNLQSFKVYVANSVVSQQNCDVESMEIGEVLEKFKSTGGVLYGEEDEKL
ncbi:TATA-binding protein-associated factor mot1 [Conglomerata obtusa]